MQSIVLFGAGKSATCLIDYLTRTCTRNQWNLFIGDADMELLNRKGAKSAFVHPMQVNVLNNEERQAFLQRGDLIISLLPPALHILIAKDCIQFSKNLLTASYVNDEIKNLETAIQKKNLLFLCEMGLDPGIDHMSAMQLIHRIQNDGGKITDFRSHTGGLVAPESDDNPWHYKISWNPANVVKAGSAGAVFREEGQIRKIEYATLFENTDFVNIHPVGRLEYYPNRDSLSYIPVYALESADTFIRTTLRYPGFCAAWKNLVKAGLTSDAVIDPIITGTYSAWSQALLPYLDETNTFMYRQLGVLENEPLPTGVTTSSKILQGLLEKHWKMQETDKDMIVMLHEIGYQVNGENKLLRSSLMVKGENASRTAMAKTVGLPLGIAARLILEHKISLTGLHIPIVPAIYDPVLEELQSEGIHFQEEIS